MIKLSPEQLELLQELGIVVYSYEEKGKTKIYMHLPLWFEIDEGDTRYFKRAYTYKYDELPEDLKDTIKRLRDE